MRNMREMEIYDTMQPFIAVEQNSRGDCPSKQWNAISSASTILISVQSFQSLILSRENHLHNLHKQGVCKGTSHHCHLVNSFSLYPIPLPPLLLLCSFSHLPLSQRDSFALLQSERGISDKRGGGQRLRDRRERRERRRLSAWGIETDHNFPHFTMPRSLTAPLREAEIGNYKESQSSIALISNKLMKRRMR